MFTRIYTGIYLSVLLAMTVNISLYNMTNTIRHDRYEHEALFGLMAFIQDSLAIQAPAKRARYLDIVTRLLGAEKSLVSLTSSAQHTGLSETQLKNIRQGNPQITRSPHGTLLCTIKDTENTAVQFQITRLSEQHYRALAILFVAELSKKNGDFQLDQLRRYTPYSLEQININTLNLIDQQQLRRLQKGAAVVAYQSDRASDFKVYAPIKTTNIDEKKALVIGPVPQYDDLPVSLVVVMVLSTIIIFAAINYVLLIRLERKLGQINQAVIDFGEGKLSTRVNLQGNDAIAKLGQRIDAMASQIESLLANQHAVIQAVSHELRTPLSRMRFRLEMLDEASEDGSLSPDTLIDKTSALRNDISQLESLANEVLEHHQLNQAESVTLAPLNVKMLVNAAIESIKPVYKNIDIDSSGVKDHHLTGNAAALQRLFENLLSNACKHANSKVIINSTLLDNEYVITVADDGEGIPEDERENIFNAFYRIDSSRNKKTGGFGIGLAIVKRIAKLHNIKVMVAHCPTLKGAAFTLSFCANTAQLGKIEAQRT